MFLSETLRDGCIGKADEVRWWDAFGGGGESRELSAGRRVPATRAVRGAGVLKRANERCFRAPISRAGFCFAS